MRANNNSIKIQTDFCNHLMNRLGEDIAEDIKHDTSRLYFFPNVTVVKSDIIRLRRELNRLSKMLDCDYKE